MNNINEFEQEIGELVENWKPRGFPSKHIMTGRYCSLELLNIDAHASELYDAISFKNKGESWTYLPHGPFKSFDEFQKMLQETKNNPDIVPYAIIDLKSNQAIGIAAYLSINQDHGTIEVGRLHFSTLLRKTPLATEAMYLMMHYVFEELQYRRYAWKCNSLNKNSRDAALRFGFKFEGTFRQCNVYKNRNRDTAWFSILDYEWPEMKVKFEKWLHENNFDQSGNQIKQLQDC